MQLLSAFFVIAVLFLRGSDSRLPDDTVPVSYVLKVAPQLGAAVAPFAGQVDIVIWVKNTTPVIVLNSKDLHLEDVKVTDVNTYRNIQVNSWKYDEFEQVHVSMSTHVLANRKYTISIWFSGYLRDDAIGFFKNYYTISSNEKKWFAASQFQATRARSAFPCYDEPIFKTPFNISIKRKINEIALSNMPISNTVDVLEQNVEATWVHFAQTPPMSTHSVALFVGDFERLQSDGENVTNVYAYLGMLYQIEHAESLAHKLLAAVEQYTDVKYALPKLDLMAMPEIATVSGGDGWGLNNIREQLLFADKSIKTKTEVSVKTAVSSAIARQWFGDLVTPSQWDFAWMNFGFATYFEYFVTSTLEPDWRLEHFFVVEKHQVALEYDRTLKNPLSMSLSSLEDIGSMFDKKSYDKGAAVLKMLHSWVGEDVFRKAVNIYLTRNRYGTVKPQQLWNAFDNALVELTNSTFHGENINTIMSSWVEQSGYPVIHVKKLENSNLLLTQERFSHQTSSKLGDRDFTTWYILATYTTSEDKNFTISSKRSVLMEPSANFTFCCPLAQNTNWYIFNLQSTSFYRVNYTEKNWLSLIEQLNDSPKDIHVLNRAQLIDDSFNLARAGKLNYTIPLSLIKYLKKEDDVIPWFSAMNSFNFVLNHMRRSKNGYRDVKVFVGKLAGRAFQMVNKLVVYQQSREYPTNIGWNAFSLWACKLDNTDCINTTLNYFRRWRNGEEIPANIKDATFCTGIRHGTEEDNWDKILELYTTTKSHSEKESALNALACTNDENLLIKCLERILKNKCPIKRQDYEAFFNALSSTPSGVNALSFFLKSHFTDIVKKVSGGSNLVYTIFSILSSKVSTENEIKMMSEIAFSSQTPVDFRNKFSSIYHAEIEPNENWFDSNNLITIREFVNPGSSWIPEPTTQTPQKEMSSSSSSLFGCSVFLCILAILPSVVWPMLD